MNKLVKRIGVDSTSKLDWLTDVAQIEVVLDKFLVRRMKGLLESPLMLSGDEFLVNIGKVKMYDEDGEEIKYGDLDWRPSNAKIHIYKSDLSANALMDVFVSIGCRDDDDGGEYLYGALVLTQEEIGGVVVRRGCYVQRSPAGGCARQRTAWNVGAQRLYVAANDGGKRLLTAKRHPSGWRFFFVG